MARWSRLISYCKFSSIIGGKISNFHFKSVVFNSGLKFTAIATVAISIIVSIDYIVAESAGKYTSTTAVTFFLNEIKISNFSINFNSQAVF